MNWQHLTYFLKIAELQNFGKAAELLYLTPSALSKAMRGLEDTLGFPLFERKGRNSILTPYGEVFYKYVCGASECINDGIQSINELLGVNSGRVVISGTYTTSATFLPERIKLFKERYPDIVFLIESNGTNKILDAALAGEINLGFCSDYEPDTERFRELERVLIKKEEVILIFPKNHWLSAEKYVDMKKLGDEKFITFRSINAGTSHLLWQLCKKAGIDPQIAFQVPDEYSIIGLVRVGLGIALIPDNPSLNLDNVSILRFKGEVPIRRQYMIWKKDHFMPPVVKAFRDFIIASLDENIKAENIYIDSMNKHN